MKAVDWKAKGKLIKVKQHNLFVVGAGAKELPCLVILHGYPSCSYDFKEVMPILSKYFRVIVHDHLGFGFSDKPLDYSYSLMEQADYALALWEQLGIHEAHLLAHDYGTSVATEIIARRAESQLKLNLKSLTLTNGSVHIELADLRLIQYALKHKFLGPIVAKFGNAFIFKQQMRRLWYDKSTIKSGELEELWKMSSSGNGRKVLPKITQYLNERYQYWDRWIGALKTLDLPTNIVWAQDDPVSVAAIGEQLYNEIPNANINRIRGVGHYPMLEAPKLWTAAVLNYIQTD